MNKQEFKQLIREEVRKVLNEGKTDPIIFSRNSFLANIIFRKIDDNAFKKYKNKIQKLIDSGKIPPYTDEGNYYGPNDKDAYIIQWKRKLPKNKDKQFIELIKSIGIDIVPKDPMNMYDSDGWHAPSAYNTINGKINKYIPKMLERHKFEEVGFTFYGVSKLHDKAILGRPYPSMSEWVELTKAYQKMLDDLDSGKTPKQLISFWTRNKNK
jgi:hypothetical protein